MLPGLTGLAGKTGAAGFLAETETLVAAMTTAPSAARKIVINDFIKALKDGGVWDQLDLLYVLAAHDSQAARLNWKNPGTYTASVGGTPTFTTDSGYAPTAGTHYLDTGWDASNNGVNFTQNDACVFARSNNNTRFDAGGIFGNNYSVSGTGAVYINPWNASINTVSHGINSSATNTFSPGNASGLFLLNRTASGNYDIYRENSSLGNQATASNALSAVDFRILTQGAPPDFANRREVSLAGCGGSLDSTARTALYDGFEAYRTALGF